MRHVKMIENISLNVKTGMYSDIKKVAETNRVSVEEVILMILEKSLPLVNQHSRTVTSDYI